MPVYKLEGPDGRVYSVEGPEGATAEQLGSFITSQMGGSQQAPAQPKPQVGMLEGAGMGLLRGAKDVIDTGALGLASLYDKVTGGDRSMSSLITGQPTGEAARVRAMNDAGKAEFDAKYGDSTAASIGRIGGNVAATMPAGGVLGYGMRAAAPLFGGAAPVASSLGNAIASGGMTTGNVLGPAANMAARIAGGGISGGMSAGLVDPSTAGTGALIGSALPPVAKAAGTVGGAIKRSIVGAPVTPEVAQLAARAKELGISVPADRLVDSKPLNALAASLNYVPFSGRSATEDAMNSQLNKALSSTFGQDSSNVTKALRDARGQLGGEFDRVLKSNAVRFDEQLARDLAMAGERASAELGTDGASIINKQIAEIANKGAGGAIDGQAAYNIKRTLDRIGQRNTPEAFYANDLKKDLMGALNRSLGPDEAQAFAKTRQQYGSMLDLEKLAKNGAEGEISVARLANMRNINNPQMQELADIAAQFVKPRESQHGAAQRVFLGSGAAAAGLAGGGLLGGIAGLGAMAGAGRATNGLLNSNMARNYVLNQGLLSQPGPLAGLLGSGLYRTAPLLGGD